MDIVRINSKQRIFLWFVLFMIVFWFALSLSHLKSGFLNNFFGLTYTLISVIAGIVALKFSSVWKDNEMVRRGMHFSGIGLVSWGLGGVVWSYYSFFMKIQLPYPSLADIFYLPGAFLYSLGIIYFARASGSDLKFKNRASRFFIRITAIMVSVVSYFILVAIARDGKLFDSGDSVLKNFLNIAYPCMDFVGLTLAVLISRISFKNIVPKYKIAIIALTIGLVLMFISDSLLTSYIIRGVYFNGCLSDLGFCIAISALTFGVLGFCSEGRMGGERRIHTFEFLRYF